MEWYSALIYFIIISTLFAIFYCKTLKNYQIYTKTYYFDNFLLMGYDLGMDVTSTLGSRRVVNDTDISFDGTIDAWNIKIEWYGASLQLPPGFMGKTKRKRHAYIPNDFKVFMSLPLVDYLHKIKYGIVTWEGYTALIDTDSITITTDSEYILAWYQEWFGSGLF